MRVNPPSLFHPIPKPLLWEPSRRTSPPPPLLPVRLDPPSTGFARAWDTPSAAGVRGCRHSTICGQQGRRRMMQDVLPPVRRHARAYRKKIVTVGTIVALRAALVLEGRWYPGEGVAKIEGRIASAIGCVRIPKKNRHSESVRDHRGAVVRQSHPISGARCGGRALHPENRPRTPAARGRWCCWSCR